MQKKLNDLLVESIKDTLLDITPEEIVNGLVEEIDLPEVVAILDKIARAENKRVFIITEEKTNES